MTTHRISPTKVRAQRQAKDLTQQGLAFAAGTQIATVSGVEQGRIRNPTIDTVGKLARALGCKIDDIVEAV